MQCVSLRGPYNIIPIIPILYKCIAIIRAVSSYALFYNNNSYHYLMLLKYRVIIIKTNMAINIHIVCSVCIFKNHSRLTIWHQNLLLSYYVIIFLIIYSIMNSQWVRTYCILTTLLCYLSKFKHFNQIRNIMYKSTNR